ncbi:hypothetical protein LCGC14_3071670, partial [marine sediment metagenome]
MFPWTTVFTSSFATDHGSLGGLADDDHLQYIKDSEFTAADEVIVGTGSGTFGQVTLGASQFLAKKAAGAATNVTAAEAMAILSGVAGAAFDFNSQNLTSVGTLNTHTIPGGTDTLAMLAATQELDNKTLDSSVLKGTFTASGTVVLPAFTLGGTMDANSQALINVLDLDLGTESLTGTFSATLTAANAGTAWLIMSKDTSDILRPRL